MHVQAAANLEKGSRVSHSERRQKVQNVESEQEGEQCRECARQQARDISRIFYLNSSKYKDICEMLVQC